MSRDYGIKCSDSLHMGMTIIDRVFGMGVGPMLDFAADARWTARSVITATAEQLLAQVLLPQVVRNARRHLERLGDREDSVADRLRVPGIGADESQVLLNEFRQTLAAVSCERFGLPDDRAINAQSEFRSHHCHVQE
jgi:hypothetical protein